MLKIMYFSASWCGPCALLRPIVDRLAAQFEDVVFEKVDIDDEYLKASNYNIQAVPTLVFVRDGAELDRVVGLVKEKELTEKINTWRK